MNKSINWEKRHMHDTNLLKEVRRELSLAVLAHLGDPKTLPSHILLIIWNILWLDYIVLSITANPLLKLSMQKLRLCTEWIR